MLGPHCATVTVLKKEYFEGDCLQNSVINTQNLGGATSLEASTLHLGPVRDPVGQVSDRPDVY